ncbi:MAG: YkgJ family cysteine cluster protein [Promethearchaeota archaeon]
MPKEDQVDDEKMKEEQVDDVKMKEDQVNDEKMKEEQVEAEEVKEPKETGKEQGKYVFQCQKCGQCCEEKDSVVVSMADLERWSRDVTLPPLFPFLTIEIKNDDYTQISLKKPETEEGELDKGCPLYDEENKLCNIYYSMPLYCKSFPLGYDGEKYFLKDKRCQGIGKGSMSEETLREARKAAKEDFEARVSTTMLLPVIHSLALKFILDQSKKQIDNLTDDQKEKLKEILGRDAEGAE